MFQFISSNYLWAIQYVRCLFQEFHHHVLSTTADAVIAASQYQECRTLVIVLEIAGILTAMEEHADVKTLFVTN